MATTQQPAQQRDIHPWTSLDGDTEGEKVETWFENVVWTKREICSNCFARLRTTSEIVVDDWDNAVEVTTHAEAAEQGQDVVSKGRIGVVTVRHDDGQVEGTTHLDEHSAKYHSYERTACGECGSVGGLATSDALPKREAVDRVPALISRLEELGHAVDTGRVYRTVRHLKSIPERSDNDKRIFAAAAALGVKHG